MATQRAQRRVAVALAGGGRGLGNVWSMTKGGRPSECFPEPYRKGPAIESSRGQRGDRIESWATRSRLDVTGWEEEWPLQKALPKLFTVSVFCLVGGELWWRVRSRWM